uniref:Activated leukocyte cell adhesion molecule n=1 Tax=Latimeria chalumnae TaxID=7897 RepID=H3AYA2_LATCH
SVKALYGETIDIPCPVKPAGGLIFNKWKYETTSSEIVYLVTRNIQKNEISYEDVPDYKDRLSLTADHALHIKEARVDDEKEFTCMLSTFEDIYEAPSLIHVFSRPTKPNITNLATNLDTRKLIQVGYCISEGGYPKGILTWFKNGHSLEANEKILAEITFKTEEDQASKLYTISSTLKVQATKEDIGASYTCQVTFSLPTGEETDMSDPVTIDVHYPTEKVKIEVISPTGNIKEGDTVILKCSEDGNPPIQDFNLYINGEENGKISTLNLTDIQRFASGEYKCSLPGSPEPIESSVDIDVHYLDITLNSSSSTALVGDSVDVLCTALSNKGPIHTSWVKDEKPISPPDFTNLQFKDNGNYVCKANVKEVKGLKKNISFNLLVEGKPSVKLSKQVNKDGKSKTITCTVNGFPKPEVMWNAMGVNIIYTCINQLANETEEQAKLHSNLLILCRVSIVLGCNKYSQFHCIWSRFSVEKLLCPYCQNACVVSDKSDGEEKVNDQAKVIVGVVVGLLLAAVIAGLIYWLYTKKSK